MKKLVYFLLLLVMPLSIGCGSKKDEPTPVTHTLTMENEKPEYGDVTPIGVTTYNENENVTLTVNVTQPKTASFIGFYDKDNDTIISSEKTCEVTMSRDYHVVVRWSLKQYQVIATSSSEKKGTVTGGGIFHFNDEVTLTALPTHGYKFIGWYDTNDEPVTTDNPYVFNVPDKDIKLIAKWDGPYFHLLKFVSEDKTIIQVSNADSYAAGDKIDVSASMLRDDNYLFAGWYEGNKKVSENINFEYTMPDTDATLTAKWKGNLDDKTWADIHDGKVGNIEVGNVKSILVNNKKHAVRVIAKNYDFLDSAHTGVARYTFQFDHIITKEDGSPDIIAWDDGRSNTNKDFINNSSLNNYLCYNYPSKTLYSLLPSDLQKVIIFTYREVGVFENNRFIIDDYSGVYLYPFSVTECRSNKPEGAMSSEGRTYTYLNSTSLVRYMVDGSAYTYWTRSPQINTDSDAWCVDGDGNLSNARVSSKLGIAPCFCVGYIRIKS